MLKKSDFSQKAVSPVDITNVFSGDVGLSKNHYEHLSLKCTDKPSVSWPNLYFIVVYMDLLNL